MWTAYVAVKSKPEFYILQQLLQYQKKVYIYLVSCYVKHDKLVPIKDFSTGNLPGKH